VDINFPISVVTEKFIHVETSLALIVLLYKKLITPTEASSSISTSEHEAGDNLSLDCHDSCRVQCTSEAR
jgi:hypothetical protein